MATITAIERQKRRQRYDVYVDGVLALTLGAEVILEHDLHSGLELDAVQMRGLEAEDQRRGAIAGALRLLAMGPRSERDLHDRLSRRGWRREAIDAAVARMRELGYLDDAAYARLFVESRQAATPRSRRALGFELQRKGIDRELVEAAVETLSDEDAAYAAARRRQRAFRNLDRQTFRKRLGAFLASRGFGYGVARGAIERCWAELHAEAIEAG